MKDSKSLSRRREINSFRNLAPLLPPKTSKIGKLISNLNRLAPFLASASIRALRRGVPGKITRLSLSWAAEGGKVKNIFEQNGKVSLFANPGVRSDSCAIIGIFKTLAA